MIIVCDLDGVVFNSEDIVRCQAELTDFIKYKGNGIKIKDKFATYKCYGWSKKQLREFEKEIYPDVGYYCSVFPFAKKVLELLKKDGCKIYAVTKREYFGKKEVLLTEKKLKQEKIQFDDVIYNQSNKVETCLKLKADIVIEDNYENIKEIIKSNIKCLYLRDISQPEIKSKYVKEVHNWGEIYRYLKTMDWSDMK